MAKIGQDAKAIVLAKWPVWVKNLKCQKGTKNDCTKKLVVCKEPLQKKQSIRAFENF